MIKISIITAVYNCRDTIAQTIESILSQDYSNIELIVIDGGSTDGTLDILNQYRDYIDLFISERDEGIYDALNKGIQFSTGGVIGFLHADDSYTDKNVLKKIRQAFCTSGVDIVYSDLVYVKNGPITDVIRYWRSGPFDRGSLKYGWMPPHPTIYARKSVYDIFGGFDRKYLISADYDFMLRILLNHNVKISYIPEVLVRMRIGGISNRSIKNIFRKSIEDIKIIHHHKIGGFYTIFCKNFRKINQFLVK